MILFISIAPMHAHAKKAKANLYLTPEEIEEIRKGTACRNLVKQFFKLQDSMGEKGLVSDFYELKILPTNSLVADKKGKYYVVYLKDAAQSARFKYPGGQYVIRDFKSRFRRSISAFVREVLAVIEGGAEYELYVRGSSSASPMTTKRKLLPAHNYSKIEYLGKINDEEFASTPLLGREISKAYDNDDLPYLRAAFLKDIVHRYYPLKEPKILQSNVAESADAGAQYAEMVLYVDW